MSKKTPVNPATATTEKPILEKYSVKLAKESLIKALVCGMTIGFAVGIVIAVICYYTNFNGLWIALPAILLCGGGASALFYFKLFRPSAKATAQRLDDIGLEERVITMLELEGQTGCIAEMQRRDTKTTLAEITPRHMKYSMFKLPIAALVLVAFFSVFSVTVSVRNAIAHENNIPPVVEKSDEDKIIDQMINDLYELIADADIREELRKELNTMVDNLVESLKPTDTLIMKIAKISETARLIHELIEKEMGRKDISETLQEHNTTIELGKAIGTGNPDKIDAMFQKMYDSIIVLAHADLVDILLQTADDIEQALEDATDTDPALAEALQALADAFREAAKKPPMGGDMPAPGDTTIEDAIKDAIDSASDAIKDALEGMQGESDLDSDIQDTIDGAIGDLTGNPADKPGSPDDGDNPDKPNPPETPPGGGAGEGGNVDKDAMIIDGKTPYLDVFEQYYEQAMALLQSGDLSPEVREMIERYFKNIDLRDKTETEQP